MIACCSAITQSNSVNLSLHDNSVSDLLALYMVIKIYYATKPRGLVVGSGRLIQFCRKQGVTHCLNLCGPVTQEVYMRVMQEGVNQCETAKVWWWTVGSRQLMSQSSPFPVWHTCAINPVLHPSFKPLPQKGIPRLWGVLHELITLVVRL